MGSWKLRLFAYLCGATLIIMALVSGMWMYLASNVLQAKFVAVPSNFKLVERKSLYLVSDAGVADLDGDGILERWTVNHSAKMRILHYPPSSQKENDLEKLGLLQVPSFPGIENRREIPPSKKQFHVSIVNSSIVVRNLSGSSDFAGVVWSPWHGDVGIETRGKGSVQKLSCRRSGTCIRYKFRLSTGSEVTFSPLPVRSDGFPITIQFDKDVDLLQVGIGAKDVQPRSYSVSIGLRDRHALALMRNQVTGQLELFISRGGARGKLWEVYPEAIDDYYVSDTFGNYERRTPEGLRKDGCPGRQVSWSDLNQDGLLDLYQVCGRSSGEGSDFRNRAYLATEDNDFVEAAVRLNLAFAGDGAFAYYASLGKGLDKADLYMFWKQNGFVTTYSYDGQSYREQSRMSVTDSTLAPIRTADLDSDGKLDLLVAGADVTTIAYDAVGVPMVVTQFPLVTAPSGTTLVDFDGDGDLEIFLVPSGLHELDRKRQFQSKDKFVLESRLPIQDARSAWIDVDHDGDLDFWVLLKAASVVPKKIRRLVDALPDKIGPPLARMLIFGNQLSVDEDSWESFLYVNHRPSTSASKVASPKKQLRACSRLNVPGESEGSLYSDTIRSVLVEPQRACASSR